MERCKIVHVFFDLSYYLCRKKYYNLTEDQGKGSRKDILVSSLKPSPKFICSASTQPLQ